MTISEARLVREIKKSCTYRRLAEVYYEKHDLGHGVQGYGEDLCKDAFKTLYPGTDIWKVEHFNPDYWEENKSLLGNFYWWE